MACSSGKFETLVHLLVLALCRERLMIGAALLSALSVRVVQGLSSCCQTLLRDTSRM